MVFANTTITSISFDFEIFPDGTCPVLNSANCGAYNSTTHLYANQPDLKLLANGANVQTWYGITPTTSGTPNTTWVHSPNSGPTNNELAPQLIASSGTITLGSGINTLEFVDWPATIGIQNVVITTPEPSSVILLGMGLLGGLGAMKRKMLG
jgi:hypothetical protein